MSLLDLPSGRALVFSPAWLTVLVPTGTKESIAKSAREGTNGALSMPPLTTLACRVSATGILQTATSRRESVSIAVTTLEVTRATNVGRDTTELPPTKRRTTACRVPVLSRTEQISSVRRVDSRQTAPSCATTAPTLTPDFGARSAATDTSVDPLSPEATVDVALVTEIST